MNNTEKFFIQFVFKDDKVMKQLKTLAGQVDQIVGANKKQAKSAKDASAKQERYAKDAARAQKKAADLQKKLDAEKAKSAKKSVGKVNALQAEQIRMLHQIAGAFRMGLTPSAQYYEKLVAKEKDVQKLMRARQNLTRKMAHHKVETAKATLTPDAKKEAAEAAARERLRQKAKLARLQFTTGAAFQSLSPDARKSFLREQRAMLGNVQTTYQLTAAKKRLAGKLRELARSSKMAERRLLSLKTIQGGLTNSTRNMIHAYASVFAIFAGVSSINRVGQGFEAMESAMFAATKSAPLAAEQIQFLDKLTSRLGLSLLDTSDAFAKLAVSSKDSMTFPQIQELFTGLTEFGTVMGVSKDKMKWAMMAVTQIKQVCLV